VAEVDSERIQQVTLNLLTNSLKFSHRGGRIEVGGEYSDNYLMIYVQDDGDGIKADDKHKLFKPFGKLKSGEGVNKQGIGLGLNICKQICELFDGMIDVESEWGVGSKFYFKFKVN
jgi:signal transduction histidine kinase